MVLLPRPAAGLDDTMLRYDRSLAQAAAASPRHRSNAERHGHEYLDMIRYSTSVPRALAAARNFSKLQQPAHMMAMGPPLDADPGESQSYISSLLSEVLESKGGDSVPLRPRRAQVGPLVSAHLHDSPRGGHTRRYGEFAREGAVQRLRYAAPIPRRSECTPMAADEEAGGSSITAVPEADRVHGPHPGQFKSAGLAVMTARSARHTHGPEESSLHREPWATLTLLHSPRSTESQKQRLGLPARSTPSRNDMPLPADVAAAPGAAQLYSEFMAGTPAAGCSAAARADIAQRRREESQAAILAREAAEEAARRPATPPPPPAPPPTDEPPLLLPSGRRGRRVFLGRSDADRETATVIGYKAPVESIVYTGGDILDAIYAASQVRADGGTPLSVTPRNTAPRI